MYYGFLLRLSVREKMIGEYWTGINCGTFLTLSCPDWRKRETSYRVVRKSLCTWWLQYRKLQVMFKVSAASLQTFIDMPSCVLEDRVQYSAVHIPNVFYDGHL